MRRRWITRIENTVIAMTIGALAAACGGYGDEASYGSDYGMWGPPPASDVDGNNYEAVGTNPFVEADHDPLSTFAADVDTASYDIFRRSVGQLDELPHPDSVRLEEFVNAFDYSYRTPSQDDTAPFSVTLAAAPSPFGETVVMGIGIQGLEIPIERKPANLVFLIDTSGSMTSADKLPLVQRMLRETLTVLEPSDTVSVVTYAGSTEVRLGPTPVSQSDRIARVIEGLASGGSTAGAAGLDLAYEQAQAGFLEYGINHVVLCTDGDFNVGPSSTDELLALIEAKRETGITLTVLGFGWGNLNDGMMEAISNAGNGIYGVIIDEDHAIEYVHDSLLGTLVHIAKDVKFQVEFNPDEVYAYRLLGYENRALDDDDFRDDRVDAGEVGSGMTVTALYEVVLAGNTLPQAQDAPGVVSGAAADLEATVGAGELARIYIRFKAPDATDSDPAEEVVEILRTTDIAGTFSATSTDFQWAVAVAAFAEIMKDSPYANPSAFERLEDVLEDNASSEDRTEFLALFRKARALTGR